MTYKQRFLQLLYPLVTRIGALTGKGNKILQSHKPALTSFYSLKAVLNNGSLLEFASLKNKKVLIVNTASDCGYTNQYEALQALQEKFKENLVLLGFPSNDFAGQEKGSDEAIAAFCKVNFGVSFPLFKKTTVLKKEGQHEVYQWLAEERKNGWNEQAPSWNFCKYLIDENGNLTHYFESAIDPMGKEVIQAVES
jgi:glutathione peroxidase